MIGALKLHVSTPARIEAVWGAPGYTTSGNVLGSSSGYPDYTLFGYRCRPRRGVTFCAINFYVSQGTGRLESFETTSRRFELFGGVHVGMPADVASRREREPDISGCGQGIVVPDRRMSIDVGTRGGHDHFTGHTERVSGGRVADIAIDDKRYGVGVLFC
jgi:hypothetical protein